MTVSSKTINITNAISEAYLSITQDIGQSIITSQIVNVDCQKNPESDPCVDCIKALKDIYDESGTTPDMDDIRKTCQFACECKIEDIKLSQQLSINFQAFQQHQDEDEFVTRVMDSLTTQAVQTGTSLPGLADTDKVKSIQKNIKNIYSAMKTSGFMESVQQIKTLQNIQLKGGGTIAHVDMNAAITFVSQVIQTQKDTKSIITKLETDMLSMTYQIIDAGLAQVIMWVVQIIFVIVVLIVLGYATNLFFTLYTTSLL